MPSYPGLIDLSGLDGSNGLNLVSSTTNARLLGVAGAGDVNGDGFDDTIITMRVTNSGPQYNYVLFGTGEALPAEIDLAALDGTNGFVIEAAAGSRQWFATGVGDVNGDGFADIAVGSSDDPVFDYEYEDVNIVFGGPQFEASFSLGELDGTNGLTLAMPDNSGRNWVFKGGGDVNGDGFDDIILGESYEARVFLGAADGFTGELPLLQSTVVPFQPVGLGTLWTAAVGDINDDGYSDMAFGNAIVFGSGDGFDPTLTAEDLDGSNGFVLENTYVRDIAAAGDVNGDGIGDFIVGNPNAEAHGHISAGEAYVVFGKTTGFDASIDLRSLDGTDGFIIRGETLWQTGTEVNSAGDVNGDGFDDVLVRSQSQAHVVFGKATYHTPGFDLAELDGTHGFRIDDSGPYTHVGSSAGVGDFNGDGFSDLAFAVTEGGTVDEYRGAIVYGLEATTPVTRIDSSADQTVRGGTADDVLISYGGNDRLIGGGGDDSLRSLEGSDTLEGGLGNDEYFVFADHSDTIIDTGGIDTIRTTTHWDLAGNPEIENVVLSAAGDWNVAGNALDNRLVGSFGSNVLDGRDGDDRLEGGGGSDVLIGGWGRDVLIGGAGKDRFDFVSNFDSHVEGGARDAIVDFQAGEIINLGKVDANVSRGGNQAFAFVGEAEFSGAAGELRYDYATYSNGDVVTIVSADTDGDGQADFGIELRGQHVLTGADFIL